MKKPKFHDAGDRIVMDISIAEARVLMILLDRCGGDPQASPRKYIDSLGSALQAAGIEPPNQDINDWCEGDISFRTGDIKKNWPKNPDYKGFMLREKRGNVLEWKRYTNLAESNVSATQTVTREWTPEEISEWWNQFRSHQ